MSRPTHAPSIQLFPFLAVLVCAMGALILLLLVTTSLMRQKLQARAIAAATARTTPAMAASPAVQSPPPTAIPSGPTPEELQERELKRTARRAAQETKRLEMVAARRRQADREHQWRRQVAEAEIARDERRRELEQSTQELDELRGKLQVTETNLSRLRDKKSQLKSLEDHDAKWLAQAEAEHQKLTDEIAASQKKLADMRRAHVAAASKYAFIPYDGASGTTRRPLYVECTSTGIRFQPENELLDEEDLKGFTESFNPLLLAAERLMQYWREQPPDEPGQPVRPYVLLIVRPKGTVAYYVARKMLSQLGDEFGYELIEEDFPLQLPAADPNAKLVIRQAVAEALRNRGEMLAAGGRPADARLGQVLMGRSEEVIEFGTLDEQVAASVAAQESPFAKNTQGAGRGFTVTRSPVEDSEVRSRSLQSAVQEQKRRQASGLPGGLGSVGNTVSAGPARVPGSLAEMTGGPGARGPGSGAGGGRGGSGTRGRGTGDGGGNGPASILPGPVGSKPGPVRPGDPRTYALSDPFSRDRLATGQQGAAGDDLEQYNGEDGTDGSAMDGGGGVSQQTVQRNGPQGVRRGKVVDVGPGTVSGSSQRGKMIDLAPGGAAGDPAPGGAGLASDGSTGASGTGSRTPGGAAAGRRTTGSGPRTAARGKPIIQGPDASPISDSQDPNPELGLLQGAAAGLPGGTAGAIHQGGPAGGATSSRISSQQRQEQNAADVAGSGAGAGTGDSGFAGEPQAGASSGATGSRGPRGTMAERPGALSRNVIGSGNVTPYAADAMPSDAPASALTKGAAGPATGSPQVRSTDPNAGKNRVYGDNPEARQQLAKMQGAKPISTMQKHDSARRRWGGSNTGQIGFERKVTMQLTADRVVIGKNEIEIVIEPGTTQDELVEAVLSGLDEYSHTWGKPPERFFWVPFLAFEVYAGGHTNHERLHGALREWGIYSETSYKKEERPTQSVTNPGDAATPPANGAPQPIGPAEITVKAPGGQSPPPKKSSFNWFKRITQGAFKF